MFAPVASEQVSQSNLQRTSQQGGDGMQRALAGGVPVQMLLMLQRTAGNQAVNQLLRQYKSSRHPASVLGLPAVQRCGGKPCNCSPQEKAAHAQVQSTDEEQGLTASGSAPASVQRDADDDGADDAAQAAEQGADVAAGAASATSESASDAADGASQSAEEPAQGASEDASASNDTADATDSNAADPADQSEEAPALDGGDGASASADPADASADQTGDDSAQGDDGQAADTADSDDAADDEVDLSPIPAIEGDQGSHDEDVFGGPVDVKGKTHASYVHNFSMPTIMPTKGDPSSCSCAAKDCVHISGTMTSTFTMTPNVTLPIPPSDLNDHQTKLFQGLVDTCISPHEQQHVAIFNTYTGTEQTPFDLTCCRADVHSSLKAIHDGIEKPRHDAVQTASDALDPFVAKFDPNCPDDGTAATCTTCPPKKA
jgi:hypothetical protein